MSDVVFPFVFLFRPTLVLKLFSLDSKNNYSLDVPTVRKHNLLLVIVILAKYFGVGDIIIYKVDSSLERYWVNFLSAASLYFSVTEYLYVNEN